MTPSHTSILNAQTAEGSFCCTVPLRNGWPVRAFLPHGYEPNYPYPLLVLFHEQGGNEQQVLEIAPRLSQRNYICLSLRGPGQQSTGSEVVASDWHEKAATEAWLEDHVYQAIQGLQRNCNIHTERVYLLGIREGVIPAAQMALRYPQHFAGLIALNGTLPTCSIPPLTSPDVRDLRVFLAQSSLESEKQAALARDFRLLLSAGLSVRMCNYKNGSPVPRRMLSDLDLWIMQSIDSAFGLLPSAAG